MKTLIFLVSFISFFMQPLFAQLGLQALTSDRIDLKGLAITKTEFLDYTKNTIATNPLGLGPSTSVHFKLCDYKVKGKKLSEYKTKEGKSIAFLSNPVCKQIVITKVLEKGYGFHQGTLSKHRRGRCLRDVTEIIGPIVQFFATQIEEPAKKDCPHCQKMAQYKAKVIFKAQAQINKTCGKEAGKTANFISDFSTTVEQSMRAKVKALGK